MAVPGIEGKPAKVEADVIGGETDGLLRAVPNERFSWAFYPLAAGNWHTVEIPDGEDAGVWWVCYPVPFRHKPGLNAVRATRAGDQPGAHLDDARRQVTAAGGVWVDHSAEYPFLGEVDCKHPRTGEVGTWYHELPGRVLLGGPDGAAPRVEMDRVGYARILLRIQRALRIVPSDRVIAARVAARQAAVARIAVAPASAISPTIRPELAAAADNGAALAKRAKVAESRAAPRPRSSRTA